MGFSILTDWPGVILKCKCMLYIFIHIEEYNWSPEDLTETCKLDQKSVIRCLWESQRLPKHNKNKGITYPSILSTKFTIVSVFLLHLSTKYLLNSYYVLSYRHWGTEVSKPVSRTKSTQVSS